MNKAILIGRVGRDPETRQLDGGSFVTNFSVATSEKYKNKSGEMVESTEWHNVTTWNSTFARDYIKKGDLVSIDGKITTRSWETESGEKRYSTEINALRIDGLAKSGGTPQNQQTPVVESNGQPTDVLPWDKENEQTPPF